ncbi:MAG TPA: thioredoxin domain-containing protein [Phycisphaerae bacterium]|nr:thioredoxin domain-containing protein [Phycisphaerae bacterium]
MKRWGGQVWGAIAATLVLALSVPGGVGGCHAGSGGAGPADADEAGATSPLDVDFAIDHVKGDPSAPNVIIEYGNFLCGHCADFFATHLPDVEELVEQHRVLYVFRHAASAESASVVAQAAECAALQDQTLFFPYHDLLFTNSGSVSEDALRGYAADLGLDEEAFHECLTTEATADRVTRDVDSARELDVPGSPTFFVNGEMLAGDDSFESFEELLN